jgi:PAS domain S-box-containing protein
MAASGLPTGASLSAATNGEFLRGLGELPGLIRAFDWSKTSLGPLETWPGCLRTATGLLLASPVPMVMLWGPEGVMIYNDAYSVFAGARHPGLLGMNVREAWPEVADFNDNVMRVGLAGGTLSYTDQELVLNRRGTPERAWMNLDYSPVPDENGEPAGVIAVVIETTERVRADAALQNLNADLEKQVLERTQARGMTWRVSPDLLGALNADGYFETSNPAWQSVLGWSQEEVAAMSVFDMLHPDDVEATRDVFALTQSGQPAIRFPNRFRCKNGSFRWISWIGIPEDGLVYYSGRDITEDVAAQAERERLWTLSEDMLARADYSGAMSAVNPAWTRVLGWSEQELLTNPYASIISPEDLSETAAALEEMGRTGKPTRFENRVLSKDGVWTPIDWTVSPEPDGVNFIAIGRDLTQDKAREAELAHAQEALRQSQKMEAVGQLTGGIAHDFNNLLAGIGGSLELLQKRLKDGRLDGVDRYIGVAQASTDRAAALTQRLLAFSRRQTLDPKPTDVNRLIGGMEELIRRTAGPGVELEVVGAGGLWLTRIDGPQLENALLNLALNARDAMPDGGRITIETANKWLDEQAAKARDLPPGQYISVCVTDTGSGMTPEVIERAFDPFYTTKPLGLGTGLGLSMVHGFVRQSGGEVRIYSEVGKGTTMCLYLPRFIGELGPAEAIEPVHEPAFAHGETVLVVDDEAAVRMLIVDVLTEAGYHVLDAPDGPAAFKILQSDQRIDLLITDVGLPGGFNGRQVADAARTTRSALKVLFITGYAENAVIGNGHLDAGMQVITKPFAMTSLANRVRDILDS